MSEHYPEYEGGQVLERRLDGSWAVLSFVFSLGGAYAACSVIDVFRVSPKRSLSTQLLLFLFAALLGECAIWWMHFTSMAGITLYAIKKDTEAEEHFRIEYNISKTLWSCVFAVLFVYIGSFISSRDVFFGADKAKRMKVLNKVITLDMMVGTNKASTFKLVALFTKPWYLLAGGTVTAAGVMAMHYMGMAAIHQHEFEIRFTTPGIIFSCLLTIVVATTGFWIVFRFLQWKPKSELIRFLASVVLAVAVSSCHYVGMIGASYHLIPLQDRDPTETSEGYQSIDGIILIGTVLTSVTVYVSLMILTFKQRQMFQGFQETLTKRLGAVTESQTGYTGSCAPATQTIQTGMPSLHRENSVKIKTPAT